MKRLSRAVRYGLAIMTLGLLPALAIPAVQAQAAVPNAACGHGATFSTRNVKGHRNVKMAIVASCIGVTPRQMVVNAVITENGNEVGGLIRDKYQRVYKVNLYGRCAVNCVDSSMVGRLTTDFYFSQPEQLGGVPVGCVLIDSLHLECLQSWHFAVESDGKIYMLPPV